MLPASDMKVYEAMCELAAQKMPGFKVAYKDESWFMKLLGVLTKPFCPDYMTNYITTFWTTVYYPTRTSVVENYGGAWKVMAHELTHGMDWTHQPIRFIFGYGFPQILAPLALLAVGAFWNLWWLLALLFLVALAPWPSPGRTKWELRGYTMSMAVNYWRYGSITEDTKEWVITGPLTGWGYYKMGWSVPKAKAQVEAAAKSIEDGTILQANGQLNPFLDVYNLLKSLGVTK
jgi:hypothetical protein